MNNWPKWIPSPNAWMSSLLLIVLVRGIAVLVRVILQMSHSLLEISPKLQILMYLAALLSPILIIAIVHHFIHLFFDRSFPNIRSPENDNIQGIFPGLMSWWEGFYGWMTIALAFLLTSVIEVIFYPGFNYYGMLNWWEELKDLFTLTTLLRIFTAAYIYQLEQLVRKHLMFVGATNRSN